MHADKSSNVDDELDCDSQIALDRANNMIPVLLFIQPISIAGLDK